MPDDDRRLPAWALALVFAMGMVAGAAMALLIWIVAYIIPMLRATAGGLS